MGVTRVMVRVSSEAGWVFGGGNYDAAALLSDP